MHTMFLIEMIALMVTAESLNVITKFYSNLYVVLMSTMYSEHVTRSMAELLALRSDQETPVRG
jgi:hypothetical protein